MVNPFEAPPSVNEEAVVFGEAVRKRGGLLHREIEFRQPVAAKLVYDGKWFRQKIEIDGHVVWYRISWLTIHRTAKFKLPGAASADPDARMEVDFTKGLGIRRFRVWMNDELAYDEIN